MQRTGTIGIIAYRHRHAAIRQRYPDAVITAPGDATLGHRFDRLLVDDVDANVMSSTWWETSALTRLKVGAHPEPLSLLV